MGFLNNKIYVYVVIPFRDSMWCFQNGNYYVQVLLCVYICIAIRILPIMNMELCAAPDPGPEFLTS